MKTIVIDTVVSSDLTDNVTLIADSAVLRDGKPFFVPDFNSRWRYDAAVAFRVGRLGRSIGLRFASRYVDAVTAAVLPVPVDALSRQPGNELLHSFDGALLIGEWHNLPNDTHCPLLTIGGISIDTTLMMPRVYAAVSEASMIATLKMGDIIVMRDAEIGTDLLEDTLLSGCVDDVECLHLRVK